MKDVTPVDLAAHTLDDLRQDHRTLLPVTDVFGHLTLSRSAGYELIRRGRFPLPVLRVGARLRVRRADLLAYLVGATGEAS